MSVDVSCLIFGVHNGLILIKTVITGNCVAYGNCDQVKGYALKSKKFKSD